METDVIPELRIDVAETVREVSHLGDRGIQRPDDCADSERIAPFRVSEIGWPRIKNPPPSIILIIDVFPGVWICAGTYRLNLRGECMSEDLRLIPRLGCVSMDFALLLRTPYADYLRVEGARRAIGYTWATRVMDILRRSPR